MSTETFSFYAEPIAVAGDIGSEVRCLWVGLGSAGVVERVGVGIADECDHASIFLDRDEVVALIHQLVELVAAMGGEGAGRMTNLHPVDSSRVEVGDPSGMDLDSIFAAIEAGRIAGEDA